MSSSRLVFKEANVGKFKTVRHFELVKDDSKNLLKSDRIQLSTDRKFANSSPDFWLKAHNGKNWGKNITGLFKTVAENTYFGDLEYKKHLVIMHLEGKNLELKIYQDYYPFHKNEHPTVTGRKIKFYKKENGK